MHFFQKLTTTQQMYISKPVLLFGILATFLSYQAHFLGESVMQLSMMVMSCTGGPMLGLVTLGIFFSFVNQKVMIFF